MQILAVVRLRNGRIINIARRGKIANVRLGVFLPEQDEELRFGTSGGLKKGIGCECSVRGTLNLRLTPQFVIQPRNMSQI